MKPSRRRFAASVTIPMSNRRTMSEANSSVRDGCPPTSPAAADAATAALLELHLFPAEVKLLPLQKGLVDLAN